MILAHSRTTYYKSASGIALESLWSIRVVVNSCGPQVLVISRCDLHQERQDKMSWQDVGGSPGWRFIDVLDSNLSEEVC